MKNIFIIIKMRINHKDTKARRVTKTGMIVGHLPLTKGGTFRRMEDLYSFPRRGFISIASYAE